MGKAFGFNFEIINDTQQVLDPAVFQGGPWLHLATVKSGMREYMAFRKVDLRPDNTARFKGDEVWVEILDPHEVALRKIEDDSEWEDVTSFLKEAGLLEIGSRRELHIDRKLVHTN